MLRNPLRAKSQLSALSSSFFSPPSSSSSRMKHPGRSTIFSFAAASCLSQPAWSYVPNAAFHTTGNHAVQRRDASFAAGWRTTSNSLHQRRGDTMTFATVAKEGEAYSAAPPSNNSNEHVVSEGAVVAKFAGGFSAVRVLEDMSAPATPILPVVGGMNGAAPNAQKPAASATGDDLQGRNVIFSDGSRGVVVAHRPPVLFVYSTIPSNEDGTEEGMVQILNTRMRVRIPSKEEDAAGVVGVKDIAVVEGEGRAVFAPIPQVKDIALINNPMLTGITMIDALAPIGRGQNMLFIGHDVNEMRQYTVDFLANQVKSNPDVACVYAAIDDAEKVYQLLEEQGIRQSVQVVAPTSMGKPNVDEMSSAAEAVATASTACAIAESLALKDGTHTIVVVDTLDWHKKLWDGTTRVLVDVFGIDSVVQTDREGGASSEMRAFFSTLVQRSAQYKVNRGGGSVTLLMLVQIPRIKEDVKAVFDESEFDHASDKVKDRIKLLTKRNIPLTVDNLRKIDIPIPSESEGKRRFVLQHVDDLISMSDGQIWMDEKLEAAGQSPPMDPQRSVTRVGIGADTVSRADAPALRRIVEGLRLILSQAANMVGAEANSASIKQVKRQKAFLLAMHQRSGKGFRSLSESCAALLAAAEGHLDQAVDAGALAGTEKGQATMDSLLQHLHSSIPDLMQEINQSLDLSDENKKILSQNIESFMRI